MHGAEKMALLESLALGSPEQYKDAAFGRNLGLLSYAAQQQLDASCVAIAGMGGVGGVHLMTLARTGIGRFHVADMDAFSVVNVNRQFGATIDSFGKPKLSHMVAQARGVNPYLDIMEFPEGIHAQNIDAFLKGVDIVVDGIDFFAFNARHLLFNRALELGIPVVTAGPIGFSTALLTFLPESMNHRRKRSWLPGSGAMTFDEYFHIAPDMPQVKKYLHFAMGLSPRPTHLGYLDRHFVDLHEKRGPSLHIACQLCAALTATEVVRILTRQGPVRAVPMYTQFDPNTATLRKGTLLFGNKNPLQKLKIQFAEKFLLARSGREGLEVPDTPAVVSSRKPVTEEAVAYVVRAGVQAPSGDNVQPWWVTRVKRPYSTSIAGLDVHMRPELDTSFFNVRQMASILSCGAVVENMRIAASAIGLGPVVEWKTAGLQKLEKQEKLPPAVHVARLNFEPDGFEREEVLHDALWRRCTNRQMYAKTPVPAEVWQRLETEVRRLATQKEGESVREQPADNAELLQREIKSAPLQLDWVTGKDALRQLGKAVALADNIRVERQDLHEYFMSMVRFSKLENKETGLPLRNLCAGGAGDIFLRLTKPWRVMATMNAVGIGRLIPMHSIKAMVHSGGAGLLSLKRADARSVLTGGQALERLWIMLEHMGFAMQPMTAITLFKVRELLEGDGAFYEKHREYMQQAWGDVEKLFPDSKGRIPLMLFRVGRGPRLQYGTHRKQYEAFMKELR